MRLTILYDNTATREGLREGWGFSCLVEAERNILFDTGWMGEYLKANMEELGFRMEDVDAVVLSHEHWDHAGGLPYVLNHASDPDVYVPSSLTSHLKQEIARYAKLHEVTGPQQIAESVLTTGELKGEYKGPITEQSLILKTRKGVVALTGCSHPGVKQILDAAGKHGPLHGLIGGLHGFSEYDALEGLRLIVPAHCTQHPLEIRGRHPDAMREGGVGWTVEL